MKTRNESGIALIAVLLILTLLGVLLQAYVVSVNSDQSVTAIDRDQNRAFYSALAGLEQLTADLGTLHESTYRPTNGQLAALVVNPPSIPGVNYIAPDGASGYQIQYPRNPDGTPHHDNLTIPHGPYEGLIGLMTPYTITVTAKTITGGEVQMQRSVNTADVPVFQFGIFSETDLSFFAGPNFSFGGRVHTNGNLFLAEGDGSTLTMRDKVTAVGEVVRTNLNNGWPTSNSYNGHVSIITTTGSCPGACRDLAMSEGSLTGTLGSPRNNNWTNISMGAYNGNIRSGFTGARRMDLPLVSNGATPADLIRRPVVNSNEDAANPNVFQQRFFSMASLRILISDNIADLTGQPTITAGAPVYLANPLNIGGQFVGESNRNADTDFKSQDGRSLIEGYIKIEMQDTNHVWSDVTQEILQLGISGRDLTGVAGCNNIYPNSIIHLQRLRDNPVTAPSCGGDTNQQYQYWPNVLYDTREGNLRDTVPTADTRLYLGGVMHYVELDVTNLARWFTGAIAGTGGNAIHETGYVVYFSDRRGNRNPATNTETAEFGSEDFVNPADIANGTPNGQLDAGEDVNGNNTLDTYGATPRLPTGSVWSPLDGTATPRTTAGVTATIARKNRAIFFRRALKLVNGAAFSLGNDTDGTPWGLAIASENPVYIKGNYNSTGGSFNGAHLAASVLADAVTLLSNAWDDRNSFNSPNNPGGRASSNTWYRTAIIAGKGVPFPNIDLADHGKRDFGTDGGVHNFLRYLEDWGGTQLNYMGSIVSLFFNRQATGTYKCCNNVYSPPTRGYNFDVEFLQPNLLPPKTPMFRDVNITGFTQMKMPQ
jgi:hypothetical protein